MGDPLQALRHLYQLRELSGLLLRLMNPEGLQAVQEALCSQGGGVARGAAFLLLPGCYGQPCAPALCSPRPPAARAIEIGERYLLKARRGLPVALAAHCSTHDRPLPAPLQAPPAGCSCLPRTT